MASNQASFLDVSPRHPLPNTSVDHADLLVPMRALDLSDAEDDSADGFAADDFPANSKECVVTDVINGGGGGDAGGDAGVAATDDPVEGLAADQEKTDIPAVVITPTTTTTTTTTPTPTMTAKRPPSPKKAAPRVVPSRYMAESANSKHPKASTNRNPSNVGKSRTPTIVRGESPSTSGNRSSASLKKVTPKTPKTPKAHANTAVEGGGSDTPKSSHCNPELSDHDRYLARMIMERSGWMIQLDLEEKREAYLKEGTNVLISAAMVFQKLTGEKNEKVKELFKLQCDAKVASFASMTKDTLSPLLSKIDATMPRLMELEEALRVKGHEVDASEELDLPMANDAAGQASTSAKIVESLHNRVQTFLSIDAALPEEVRRKTKKLADLLSDLGGRVDLTTEQMKTAIQHTTACLNVLVAFIYRKRTGFPMQ